jgi:hypothetical protein
MYATRSAVEIVAYGRFSQVNSQGGPTSARTHTHTHTHRKMKGSLPLEKTSCVVRVVFPINFKGQTPRAKKLTVQGKRDNIKMCPEPREQCVLFAMPPLLGIEEFCDVLLLHGTRPVGKFQFAFQRKKRCFCVFVSV